MVTPTLVAGRYAERSAQGNAACHGARAQQVDTERNIGDAGQHAVPRQRRLYMFDIPDVGIQLRQMIGDSVTDYFMPGGAMRRRLLA